MKINSWVILSVGFVAGGLTTYFAVSADDAEGHDARRQPSHIEETVHTATAAVPKGISAVDASGLASEVPMPMPNHMTGSGREGPFERESLRRKRDERIRHLDAAFRSEPRAQKWSDLMETKLGDPEIAAVNGIAHPAYLNATCRSRTCRISATFESAGDIDGWINTYIAAIGSSLPSAEAFLLPRPNGGSELVIYGKTESFR